MCDGFSFQLDFRDINENHLLADYIDGYGPYRWIRNGRRRRYFLVGYLQISNPYY